MVEAKEPVETINAERKWLVCLRWVYFTHPWDILLSSSVPPSFFTVTSSHLIFFPVSIRERITGITADEQKMESRYWYRQKVLCNAVQTLVYNSCD